MDEWNAKRISLGLPENYNTPGNLQRKLELMKRHVADLRHTLSYYGPVFSQDPWFSERLREAEAHCAALAAAFSKATEGVSPAHLEAQPGNLKVLTFRDVLHLKDEPVTISHAEKGAWEDRARPVQSFMDMNHLPLESGAKLDLDDFGTVWIAYLKEE